MSSGDVLVLASASPRRTALLADWGVAHEVVVPDVDESTVDCDDPVELTTTLARLKALRVADIDSVLRSRPILAADTVVVLHDAILGKPVDDHDALRTLLALSGNTVRVVTGIALLAPAASTPVCSHASSDVVMRPFTPQEAAAYVATGEPRGKAGSFAVQGEGGRLIERVGGSMTNVIGLPRQATLDLLNR